ncbi:MAG: exopolysaccharide biosynthesis polyprenyl glycosylphosphotransferase [Caldilineaceae bacterium]|nr:exopolysaccharide biosynthesis polyprenyl glycosylphosphotransferase [Caldilineaceae bacterium]
MAIQFFSTRPRQADDKLTRAVEFYANRHHLDQRGAQRLHLRMLLWFVWLRFIVHLKRLFDIAMTILALFAIMPLMVLTAIAIRLDSPGPIIFKQTRIGKWGKPFTCYKFRSMCIDAEARKAELHAVNEADGPVFKMQEDPRVTRVGRIIRKLSIDELPQLFNVLRGEMSLVGPRPPLPDEVRQYQLIQMQRLNVVPGLTGLQQVSGRSDLDFERWIELDLQYIAEQSLRNDVRIILKTIPTVLFGRGAY